MDCVWDDQNIQLRVRWSPAGKLLAEGTHWPKDLLIVTLFSLTDAPSVAKMVPAHQHRYHQQVQEGLENQEPV